ncbi:DEAD-domain-containing protein [Cantharellus anzutake]|uniref:DEAD-domain-containing protein n=1 Tax=Cantharellus anzutake TaxID=1750568 RepID=UPI001908AAAB|nr:DEAD-domain-containing protein [Cantharellus anzutake]KAF8341457.1 DEAD-domain-containing protein [Cantharellus anzutake]
MSIRTPTPVQAFCIPPLLAGRDCIGNAKTGSGKTVAFALPILQKLSLDPYGIFALVLTPTRELALQIGDQFAVLGVALGIHTAVIVGGMDMLSQALELNNRPHIVVATPGRLVDHLNSESGEWNLSRVLDEADRLLTDTFAPDLRAIFAALPPDRQTGLFTATITPKIEKLSDAPPRPGKQKPVIYRDTSTVETVDTLKQYFVICPSHVREVYLFYLLCHPPESIAHLRREAPAKVKARWKQRDEDDTPILFPPPTIVFVTHPRTAAYLTILLQHLGIPAAALHSYLSQRDRLSSLHSFRSSVSPVLVCTDVASRGLDIEDVGMVINWDMPMGNEDEDEGGAEDYVHRVGRTARMGRGGVAVSFVTERKGDTVMVEKIEQRIKTRLEEMELPEAKVLIELNKVSVAKRTAKLNLENSNFGERQRINRKKGKNMSKQS